MVSEVIGSELTRSSLNAKNNKGPNETIEKAKAVTKIYWDYFLHYLKRPSEVLKQGETEFTNGLVTIFMMAVFVGLSFFVLLERAVWSPYEPSFFSVMGGSLFVILFCTTIVTASLVVTFAFLGPGQSVKRIAGIYGTHLIPSTFLVVIALLLLILKAYLFGNLLLSFALLLAFLIVPLYILTIILRQEDLVFDPLYCVIVYVVLFGIAFSIFFILLGNSALGSMMNRLNLF